MINSNCLILSVKKIKNLTFGFLLCFLVSASISCKQEKNKSSIPLDGKEINIKYAEGFNITDFGDYLIVSVSGAFPGSERIYHYGLLRENGKLPDSLSLDAVVNIPVNSIIVTSTTHIPSLEMLNVEHTLVGFPNLDYISSPKTRELIKRGQIKDIGQNESINTETTILTDPDLVVSFGVQGENRAMGSIERAGIPVVYNGDWVEKKPLGKAEWFKFFAAFYDKLDTADSMFDSISTRYENTKAMASKANNSPTVLSGAMFKDVWYVPQGDSWAAQLIADANADYIYAETEGTGSIALSLEEVLNTARKADYWVSPNSFESFSQLKMTSEVYTRFQAFQEKKIYGFASAKGETGGILYYELAPNRPDWVLQDLVLIFHPELMPDHKPHFFTRLEH